MSTRSRWSKVFFFQLCIQLAVVSANFGQIVQLARFETRLGQSELEYQKVVSLNEKGLLLYRRSIFKGVFQMEITRLDTALHQIWKGLIPLDQNLQVLRVALFQDKLFFLFRSLTLAGNFEVLAINADHGDYKLYNINNLIQLTAREFVVTKNAFFVGGSFNYRPLVLYYDLNLHEARILPGFFNEQGDLMQIKAYESGSVDVVVSTKNIERQQCLRISNYDSTGNLAKTIVLEPGPKKNLIFGQSIKAPGGGQVVAGVYGRFTNFSRGVFVAQVDPAGEYQINYYNFGDLQNFFNYMKARKVQRIKERIDRRKIKGKKIKFNYRLLVHNLIQYKDKYLLVGEAFYPTYRSTYGAYGYFSANPTSSFDGFQYTHAVVIGFTKNGKLLWDNSFEINDIKTFQLDQYVKINPEENRTVLLYLFQGLIRSKIIKDDKVVEGKTNEVIEVQSNDTPITVDYTELAKLENWYGKNFYVWGVQHVRNLSQPANSDSRRVFFIAKVTYP